MKFSYIASSLNGKITEGVMEASGTAELLQILAAKGLRPVSIKPVKGAEAYSVTKKFFGQRISLTDQIFLTKYLAIMLKVGTDLFQAINILIKDFEKPAMRALLIEIRENLERGQPFYATFAKYPKVFSPVFVNLVRSGEATGNLEHVFEDLSDALTKEKDLRSKVRSALVYPIILLSLSVIILFFLTSFALPKIANIFTGGGFKPPTFSKIVFAVGLFLDHYLMLIMGILLLGIISILLFSRTLAGKRFFARMRIKMPVIRQVIFRLAIQRFATTLSSLLKAGVPIIDALNITAGTVSHPLLQESILRIKDNVAQGISLGDSFRKETAFPFVVSNLIAISEKAGHLDEILDTMSRFYESEIDAAIKNAVTFIEPILLLFIGVIIGVIALAIIVPVYQLVGQL